MLTKKGKKNKEAIKNRLRKNILCKSLAIFFIVEYIAGILLDSLTQTEKANIGLDNLTSSTMFITGTIGFILWLIITSIVKWREEMGIEITDEEDFIDDEI